MTDLLSYNLGVQAFEDRDYRGAIEHFTTVLDSSPENLSVREYLARAHFHRAALGPAEEQCRAILESNPTNDYVQLLLVRALERQNRHTEAAAARRVLSALTGDPDDLRTAALR